MIKTAATELPSKLTDGSTNIKTLELYWEVSKQIVQAQLLEVNRKYYPTNDYKSPKFYADLISAFGEGYRQQILDIYRKVGFLSISSVKQVEQIKLKLTAFVDAEAKERLSKITEGREKNILLMKDANRLIEATIVEMDSILQKGVVADISKLKKEKRESRNWWLHNGFVFALGILSNIIYKFLFP